MLLYLSSSACKGTIKSAKKQILKLLFAAPIVNQKTGTNDVSSIPAFVSPYVIRLLHLGYDSLECIRIVQSQVGEHLTVNLNAGLGQLTHQH